MTTSVRVIQWLLAEQVRHTEQAQGRIRDDASANAVAKEQGLDLAQRIVSRAEALPDAQFIQRDFKHLGTVFVWFCVVLGVLAMVAAAGAVRVSIDQREIEILAVVASLLGLPTVLLVLWLFAIFIWRRPAHSTLLTAMTRGLFHRLGPRVLSGPRPEATLAAAMGLLLSPSGRWLMGLVSHGFWLIYLSSALLILTVLLAVSQYDLGWGTTLLSEAQALKLLAMLAYLPELFGLITTDDGTWLVTGRLGVAPELVRGPWAQFLLALIVVYGILPRMVAALLSAGMAWHGFRHLSLDLRQPGYLRLSGLLMETKSADASDDAGYEPERRPMRVASKDASGVITLALEVGPDASTRPLFGSNEAIDLGVVETRADRERAMQALSVRKQRAAYLVVQCSARRTPDRGLAESLNQLADAAGGALLIVLPDTESLGDWGVDPAARLADWSRLAAQTGGRIESFHTLREMVGLS